MQEKINSKSSKEKEKKKKAKDIRDIKGFLKRLVLFIGVLFILFGLVFGIKPVPNNEMKPKLYAGDLALIYRLPKEFKSGDVVMYNAEGKLHIGRIIATENESVDISNKHGLSINGDKVLEGDIYFRTGPYKSDVKYPVNLEKDEYFILADLREGSKDSRVFGTINSDDIVGKVISAMRRSRI